MTRITIENFSCIKHATLETKEVNIIIGEQATGKSIISKLVYFFNDVIEKGVLRENEITPIDEFHESIESLFRQWFPPTAWGEKRFAIGFENGPIGLHIERKGLGKKNKSTVNVTLSAMLTEVYKIHQNELKSIEDEINSKADFEDTIIRRFDMFDQVYKRTRARIVDSAAYPVPNWQLFIPAGRSFFTSLGKAITAFERSGMLDPVTLRFGEFFLTAKQRLDRSTFYFPAPKPNTEMKSVMELFFGGKIVSKKDDEYVETSDGRLIPLPFLSSGQQELLPLWLSIEQAYSFRNSNFNVYIEEPEAHIFPSTQSLLVESLIGYLSNSELNTRMLITTHSPYVLAKINNLIKADKVGSIKKKRSKVESVIGRKSWLKSETVTAHRIEDGRLINLIDEDGLIDSDFLDGISSEISEEYMKLVEIECE